MHLPWHGVGIALRTLFGVQGLGPHLMGLGLWAPGSGSGHWAVALSVGFMRGDVKHTCSATAVVCREHAPPFFSGRAFLFIGMDTFVC